MAVPVAQHVEDLLRRGRLDVRAGRIQDVSACGDHARVAYRPQGCASVQVIEAQRVIFATGTKGPGQTGNALLGRLMDRGLARPDRHGLGLDLNSGLAVIDSSGQATHRLWAVGPLCVGTLWECMAVPDIRQHAIVIAEHVAAALSDSQSPGRAVGMRRQVSKPDRSAICQPPRPEGRSLIQKRIEPG